MQRLLAVGLRQASACVRPILNRPLQRQMMTTPPAWAEMTNISSNIARLQKLLPGYRYSWSVDTIIEIKGLIRNIKSVQTTEMEANLKRSLDECMFIACRSSPLMVVEELETIGCRLCPHHVAIMAAFDRLDLIEYVINKQDRFLVPKSPRSNDTNYEEEGMFIHAGDRADEVYDRLFIPLTLAVKYNCFQNEVAETLFWHHSFDKEAAADVRFLKRLRTDVQTKRAEAMIDQVLH